MRSVFTNGSQVGRYGLYKLCTNQRVLPQVVFATNPLCTIRSFVRSLFERAAQVYTPPAVVNNFDVGTFIHIVHNPNNSYDKGE